MPTGKRPKLIIAIDGPAGSGKSSTAKALAARLKLPYIDTGAMYRAVTLAAMRQGIDFLDTRQLVEIAGKANVRFVGARSPRPGRGNPAPTQRVLLNGHDVTDAIRDPNVTKNVFYIAQEPLIRREMVKKQRAMGEAKGGVMEGRDIGTVVFPDANCKFYFVANTAIRAQRRHKELVGATPRGRPGPAQGPAPTIRQVLKDITRRDRTDYRRKEGPLKKAKDAIRIDTSALTIDETIDRMLPLIHRKSLNKKSLHGSA